MPELYHESRWISTCGTIRLVYINAELKKVYVRKEDKVSWDALRHSIEIYEEDLDKKLFKQR